jgi:hypothetical protein
VHARGNPLTLEGDQHLFDDHTGVLLLYRQEARSLTFALGMGLEAATNEIT